MPPNSVYSEISSPDFALFGAKMGTREKFSERRQPLIGTAVLVAVAIVYAALASAPALAASGGSTPETAWQADAIGHAQAMRKFPDHDHGSQAVPDVIPQLGIFADPSGKIATQS